MADLPSPPTPTLTAIYADYEARQGDGFRDHLGASIIGKSCERALWYDFRWVTPSRFSGRLLRLFETGQLEEDRMVRNLRATGAPRSPLGQGSMMVVLRGMIATQL